jgi:16S rRNA (guanine966-N2)-methyltransferase
MRITGGRARGIQINAPKGRETRPATDQMREAVFSSLGPRINGSKIADLFAGTGAYGLEALSRGASHGLFVENSSEVVTCLRRNLDAVAKSCELKAESLKNWTILAQKVYALNSTYGPFDIVFVDPPYAMIETKLASIFQENIAPITAPDGLVCFEMPGALQLELQGWTCIRRLGKTGKDKPSVAFYQRAESSL